MAPGISVIIPTYNSAGTITQAINAVLAQGIAPCEIIVVDDGSTDETAVSLQPYQNKIQCVAQEHSGLAAACNRGLSLAQHEFVLFLDAHDVLLAGKLQQQAAFLQLRPSLGYVAGGWQPLDAAGQIVQTVAPWQHIPELNLEAWLQFRQVRLGALLFRRVWLHRVGGLDGSLSQAHDLDLLLRLSLAGCTGEWLFEPTLQYQQPADGEFARADSVMAVLDKLFAHPGLPEQVDQAKSNTYFYTLLWLGWSAFCRDDAATAVSCLSQTLTIAPQLNSLSPEQTVVEWLFHFANWGQENGRSLPLPEAAWAIFWQAAPDVPVWPELRRLADWWQADQPDAVRRAFSPFDLWRIFQSGLDWECSITELNAELILSWWALVWLPYAQKRFDDAADGWHHFHHLDQFRLLRLVQVGLAAEPGAVDSTVLSLLWQEALAHDLLVEPGFDETAFFAALLAERPLPRLRPPRVSVIVPVYNGAAHIVQTVDSVLAQVYSDFELIVVDDGSTDGTAELLRPYRGKLRLIQQENQGVSAARNQGLRLALGEFILFLDGDDLLYPDKLKHQVAILEADHLLGAVHSGWRLVDEYGRPLRRMQPWRQSPELALPDWLRWKPVFLGAMLFRRSWLQRIAGFRVDLRQAEDTDFLLRLALAGCPMRWYKRITIDYRQHGAGVTQNGRRQAKDLSRVLDDFFSNDGLPPSVKALTPTVQQYTALWLVWQLHRTGYPEEITLYLRRAVQANGEHPPTILAQIWLVQLASYGREEGLELNNLRAFYPHVRDVLQFTDPAWAAIERMLDWWLAHWQLLHDGELGNLYQVQQIVHGAIHLEEAGHIRSAVEWVEWWLKVWRTFLREQATCGAGHELAAFQDKSVEELVHLAKGSIVYAPHKVQVWQIKLFWRQVQAFGLVRPSESYRVVSLYLTYFGQSLLGKEWGRAALGLVNAIRFSLHPKAVGAWVEFFQFGFRYWRNGRLGRKVVS